METAFIVLCIDLCVAMGIVYKALALTGAYYDTWKEGGHHNSR